VRSGFIGIDNGVTGSICLLSWAEDGAPGYTMWRRMPCRKEQNYTKKSAIIARVDMTELRKVLGCMVSVCAIERVLLERPMVNPMRFKATVSALRALEATQIALDDVGVPYSFIDSREWQKKYLPGVSGDELKEAADRAASVVIGSPVPSGGGDSVMIAKYALDMACENRR